MSVKWVRRVKTDGTVLIGGAKYTTLNLLALVGQCVECIETSKGIFVVLDNVPMQLQLVIFTKHGAA
jgi:hypothetical protein